MVQEERRSLILPEVEVPDGADAGQTGFSITITFAFNPGLADEARAFAAIGIGNRGAPRSPSVPRHLQNQNDAGLIVLVQPGPLNPHSLARPGNLRTQATSLRRSHLFQKIQERFGKEGLR